MNNRPESDRAQGVAIIGMAGRFPGAKTIDEFWQNLRDGVESISFLSDQELATSGIDPAMFGNSKYVKARGVLANIDGFDAAFFGLRPAEAEMMDPQHRLALECASEALESAGYNPEAYEGSIGVYIGVSLNGYLYSLYSNRDPLEEAGSVQMEIVNEKDHLPTRISYKLNLRGPSLAIQTACSTSLVTVHVACQSLLNGECDIALAGGVRIAVPQKVGYFYQEGGIHSPDGHCRAFDAGAQGTVPGSGIGVVVLKRLAEALSDGDCVHAVIKGSAINNDGSMKVSYTAPSVDGQAEVIAEALAVAEVEPDTISYIEAHGTGTPLGDPIEIAALSKVFRSTRVREEGRAIGSVKSNIGHLDTAAGVAGLIKTVLSLKYKLIPPSLNFEFPNPQADFANGGFYVNTRLRQWKRHGTPLRAGVSSFGIGGTNAHVILEEAPPADDAGTLRPWHLLVLSAKTSSALETMTKNLAEHLRNNPSLNLADVAYTLQVGRRTFDHRRIVVCRGTDDAVTTLDSLNKDRVLGSIPEPGERPIAFIFPGQGTQYIDMARELYTVQPAFRTQIDICCELLKPHLGIDLHRVLYPDAEQANEAEKQLKEPSIAQPAIFVVEYALAQLWMSCGIKPQALLGHSLGQLTAACIAGVFSLEAALVLVATRGRLMQGLRGGAMLAVALSEQETRCLLSEGLSLAAVNAPSRCVVSGPAAAVDDLQSRLARQGVACQRLNTSTAFHSEMMDPILRSFAEQVKRVTLRPPQISLISNPTGIWMTSAEATDPNYWADHIRQTVRFSDGVDELLKEPKRVILEVGPGGELTAMVRRRLDRSEQQSSFASLPNRNVQSSDVEFLLTTLGRIWLAGVEVDGPGFYVDERNHRVPLPTYPFERKRYWFEPLKTERYEAAGNGQRSSGLDVPALSTFTGTQRPRSRPAHVIPAGPEITGSSGMQRQGVPETELRLALLHQLQVIHQQMDMLSDRAVNLPPSHIASTQATSDNQAVGSLFEPEWLNRHRTDQEAAAAPEMFPSLGTGEEIMTGPLPLIPIQHWFFEKRLPDPHHWNMAILLEARQALAPSLLKKAVEHLIVHHDGLRLRFVPEGSKWLQLSASPSASVPFSNIDLSKFPEEEHAVLVEKVATQVQSSLNLLEGELVKVVFFDRGAQKAGLLLLIVHHLAIDITSARILLEDLQTVYQQLSREEAVRLPSRTTSFKRWGELLVQHARSEGLRQELSYWLANLEGRVAHLPLDMPEKPGANTEASTRIVSMSLDAESTRALLGDVARGYGAQVSEILLTALALTLTQWTGTRSLLVDLEGHGRDVIFSGVDLSRTVGWFTNIFPVFLDLENSPDPQRALESVKERLRSVPGNGIGYGLLKYLSAEPEITEKLRALPQAEVSFNFVGRYGHASSTGPLFGMAPEYSGPARSPRGIRPYILDIDGALVGEDLQINWTYSENRHRRSTIEDLAQGFMTAVQSLISQCKLAPKAFARRW